MSERYSRQRAFVDRCDPLRVVIAIAAAIVVFGVLGYLTMEHGDFVLPGFNLDGEGNFPAAFTSFLLAGAAALCALAASWSVVREPRWLWAMAAFLAFMSIDELFSLHEWVERSAEVDWQALYLPLYAIGAVIGLMTLRQLEPLSLPGALFAAGALCWVIAQPLEDLQSRGEVLVHEWLRIPEELLEMTGSGLFCVALLVLLRRS